MTPRRRSITTLAKTTKFPSNTHHCTRRRLVDHLLASRIHIINTFIYHIVNVSPGARNCGWVGATWLGSGRRSPGGHVPHKVGGNLPIESLLFRALLGSHTLLGSLGVQLRERHIVHGGVLGTRLDGTTELTNSLLLSLNAILLGNFHHLILLVETALAPTDLKVTRLVYGNEYWNHCLLITKKISRS